MRLSPATAILAAAIASLACISCKSEYEALLNSNDVDAKYEAAFKYYNLGKYNKAGSLFESLSFLTNGMEKDDTVQYYWGLSNYKFKDYYTAETNFEKFVTNYPRSPFAPDARYLRIDCLYRQTLRYELDQAPTYKALEAITEYLKEFPTNTHLSECESIIKDLNDRLDTKAFEAAKLYYKMEDYLASHVAFVNVLKDDADNIYREQILYYTAMSSYKYAKLSVTSKQKERYLVFVDDYLNFVGEWPGSVYKKELDNLYQRAQKVLGKYSGDLGKEKKDRKYEKERRKIEKERAKSADQDENK